MSPSLISVWHLRQETVWSPSLSFTARFICHCDVLSFEVNDVSMDNMPKLNKRRQSLLVALEPHCDQLVTQTFLDGIISEALVIVDGRYIRNWRRWLINVGRIVAAGFQSDGVSLWRIPKFERQKTEGIVEDAKSTS